MQKYIPTYISSTIFDFDYDKLYALGKQIMLFDLDNTLAKYGDRIPNDNVKALFVHLHDIGFATYIISNNHKKRVKTFCNELVCDGYIWMIHKPSINKLTKWLNQLGLNDYYKLMIIGDQLLTDVVCANKMGIDAGLVKTISKKSQKWYTNINRLREKAIIKKLSKMDPLITKQILNLEKEERMNE